MVNVLNHSLQRSLRRSFRCRRSMRAWTMLLGLCYLVLSVFLPFQHNHGVGEEEMGFDGLLLAQAILQQNMATHTSNPIASLHESSRNAAAKTHAAKRIASRESAAHKPAFVKAGKTRSAHCNACEWQSMQVSVALAAFKLSLTESTPPRVVTTLPRYLRSRAIATASRGPPTV